MKEGKAELRFSICALRIVKCGRRRDEITKCQQTVKGEKKKRASCLNELPQ